LSIESDSEKRIGFQYKMILKMEALVVKSQKVRLVGKENTAVPVWEWAVHGPGIRWLVVGLKNASPGNRFEP